MSQPPQDRPPGQGGPSQGPQGQPPWQGPQGYPPQGQPPRGYPPQQGYPSSGHPQQQPYAPQSYPQQQPYGGLPPQPSQQPPQKKRTGLFVLIGAGALALILVVVAIAVNLGGDSTAAGGSGGSSTGSGSGSGSGSAPPAASASDAVAGFLQALVQQDAKTALGYAAEPPADQKLMTPAVLAASAKLAPVGNVSVSPQTDPDITTVHATYTVGSTPVSTDFEVVKVGTDWKIKEVAAPVDVSAALDGGVPMLVNGVKVTSGTLTLLPGAYRFTSGQRNYDYGRHPDVLVQSPSDDPDASAVYPAISKKGSSSALSALRKSWSSCLKSTKAKPGGCPNRWTGKYSFRSGSVKWTRNGSDPMKKPEVFPAPTSVTYRVKVDLTLKGPCTYQGRSGTCTGSLKGKSLARVTVSADKVKLRWQT